MKNLLFVLSFFAISLMAQAQDVYPGVPLYGTAANQDRTYRSLQLGLQTITRTTVSNTPDTITMIPGFVSGAGAVFHKDYYITVSDTAVLAIRDVSSSYTGSTMTLYLLSPSDSSLVRFIGYSGLSTQWALASSATSILLLKNHYTIVNFVSVGGKWTEVSRSAD